MHFHSDQQASACLRIIKGAGSDSKTEPAFLLSP